MIDMYGKQNISRLIAVVLGGSFVMAAAADAADMKVSVVGASDAPLELVMVTVISEFEKDGYANPEHTFFTDATGMVSVMVPDTGPYSLRLRKPGYIDGGANYLALVSEANLTLEKETNIAELADNRPANAWVAALDFDDENFKEHFRLQCSFCHQQATPIVRLDRSEEEWEKIINRMLRYGSRLQTSAQEKLPALLRAEHARLTENPELIPATRLWDQKLSGAQITEWQLGSGSSQLHDVFLAASGLIYVGDNLQDDLIELDPKTGRTVTHKIPRREDDELGGNIGGRLKNYPGVGTYVGLHSLDEAPSDGHLFLTGSDSSRLVEFAPETGEFTLYDLPEGYYPHTVRVDQKERVWFTMAISNQVAKFDRASKEFTFYDLPTRSFKEKMTIAALPIVMKLANMGMDTHDMAVTEKSEGLPLPYGIDIAPDGGVWFTRLHAEEIGHIDPETEALRMYKTPFVGPRRLRTDADGNVWISVFASGRLAKFDPRTEKFTLYDLPTIPVGSDSPYSLTVDRKRQQVWVNGTGSDTMMRFDIARETWSVFPLPRRRTFTRDVVVAEDGSIYTSNGSFPAWHIEDGQPTVIHVIPADVQAAGNVTAKAGR